MALIIYVSTFTVIDFEQGFFVWLVQREQGYSADQSAQVIKAYYTLIEPLSRAQYLVWINIIIILIILPNPNT